MDKTTKFEILNDAAAYIEENPKLLMQLWSETQAGQADIQNYTQAPVDFPRGWVAENLADDFLNSEEGLKWLTRHGPTDELEAAVAFGYVSQGLFDKLVDEYEEMALAHEEHMAEMRAQDREV